MIVVTAASMPTDSGVVGAEQMTAVREGRAQRCLRLPRLVVLLLSLPLLLIVADRARADCVGDVSQPGSITFAPPATITLPNSLPVGTILWTSSPITPVNSPTLFCSGTTNSGIQNNIAGQPSGGDDTLFSTNVPGLSYRLLQPDASNPLHAYPNQAIAQGVVQFNASTALQLVVTGSITPGSSMSGGQFAQWNVDLCNFHNGACRGNQVTPSPVVVFNTSSITFAAPACTVVNNNLTVTLPTVYASAFPTTGTGTTTGQTPFNVQLNCSAGTSVSVTLAPGTPAYTGALGVLTNTAGSGYAGNVGVQLFKDSRCAQPVVFGTAIPEGPTSSTMNLPFCASYYQTGTTVTAGRVTATATYTLTYQ